MTILRKYRKQQAIARRGMRRIVILSAMLLVVLVMMVKLGGNSRAPAPDAEPSPHTPESRPTGRRKAAQPLPKWQPLSLDEERTLLAKVVDQRPLGVREQREAYYYLLNKVARMSDADVESHLDAAIAYEDYTGRPEIIRGSVVEISGRLLRLEETPLDPDKAALLVVYEGQILGPDNEIYSFRLTDRPEPPYVPGELEVHAAHRVRLRGIFMQVVAYQNREDPPKYVAAPLIIGRRLIPMPPPKFQPRSAPWPWIAALAVVTGVAGVWLFGFSLRRRRPYQRSH